MINQQTTVTLSKVYREEIGAALNICASVFHGRYNPLPGVLWVVGVRQLTPTYVLVCNVRIPL